MPRIIHKLPADSQKGGGYFSHAAFRKVVEDLNRIHAIFDYAHDNGDGTFEISEMNASVTITDREAFDEWLKGRDNGLTDSQIDDNREWLKAEAIVYAETNSMWP